MTYLQIEYGLANAISPFGPFGSGNAVSFVVEQPSDLGEVAVPLDEVVQHGGLTEERIITLQNPLHALLVGADEGLGLVALHVAPHLLVGLNLRVSEEK